LKRKREKDGDELLAQLILDGCEDLGTALKHNQFGGFCLQAEDIDKA
jgi:hypothetical protein